MRPSLVVSLDTKERENNCSLLRHRYWSKYGRRCGDLASRVRNRYAITGRWSLFEACWVSTWARAHVPGEAKLNCDLPVSLCFQSGKRHSVSSSFNSYRGFSLLSWLCVAMATPRDREAPPPHAFTWLVRKLQATLLWSKFVRHCLVGFYVI